MVGISRFASSAFATLAIIAAPAPVAAQQGVLTGAAAASALRSQIDGIIASARQEADLVVFNAAVQARDALDGWERANTNTINRAFDRMDQQQRQLFANIQKAVADIDSRVADRIAQAQQVTDTVLLSINSIPTNKSAFVTRYNPRIMFPGSTEPTVLQLSGPHMHKADLSIRLEDGTILKPIDLTATGASFLLPAGLAQNQDGSSRPVRLSLSYLSRPYAWFAKKRMEQPLTPWVLPSQMASYTIVPTVEVDTIERRFEDFHTGRLSGRNRNVFKGVNPPAGWKFDLERFSEASVRGNGGEAGRCQQVADHDRSENGVLIQGRVDQIREGFPPRWEDGWIRCIATLPLYRVVTSTQRGSAQSGTLGWYSDVRVDAPARTTDWTVSVRMFDGQVLTFTGAAAHKYLQVTADSTGVTLSPRRPEVK